MIRKHGIIGAVELIVTKRKETEGYRVLVEMGMEDMAFEAVVLRPVLSHAFDVCKT